VAMARIARMARPFQIPSAVKCRLGRQVPDAT
jgi:hypothetical protein